MGKVDSSSESSTPPLPVLRRSTAFVPEKNGSEPTSSNVVEPSSDSAPEWLRTLNLSSDSSDSSDSKPVKTIVPAALTEQDPSSPAPAQCKTCKQCGNLDERYPGCELCHACAKPPTYKDGQIWCEMCERRPASVNLDLSAGTHRECRSCWNDR